MKKLLIIIAVSACFISGNASAETLDNNSVVTMTKAGLGEATVIAKINGSANTFDLSTAQLITLKRQGLSDAVIAAMLETSNKARVSTNASGASNSPNPMDPHASGIYVLSDWTEKAQMVRTLESNCTAIRSISSLLGSSLTNSG